MTASPATVATAPADRRTASGLGPSPEVPPLDVARLRMDFPILSRRVHDDRALVYLDNAATSQKPTAVLEAMRDTEKHRDAMEFRW